MRVGITGAKGFLGAEILKYLSKSGLYTIRALSRTAPLFAAPQSNIQWVQGDLSSRAVCDDFVKECDALLHFAHTNTALTSDQDPPADALANLFPTLTLLESLKLHAPNCHFVYASSGGAVYGNATSRTPFREDTECRPLSAYGIQKLTTEQYLRVASEKSSMHATVLRMSNPYGVALPSQRAQGFIGVAVQRIKQSQPVKIFSPLETVRDYLHLNDLFSALELVLQSSQKFRVFNIGSGAGNSLQEVVSILKEFAPQLKIETSVNPEAISSLPSWNVLDVSKAKGELHWQPKISLQSGIRMLCNETMS